MCAWHYQFSRSLKLDGSADMEKPQHKYFMTLVLPFIVLGIFALFIPYRMSYWLSKQLAKRSSQYSSWALSTAFLLFPLWIGILGLAVWLLSGKLLLGILTMFLIVGCGFFTSKYFNTFALFIFATMWPGRKSPVDVLREMRDELIREIESLEADDQILTS